MYGTINSLQAATQWKSKDKEQDQTKWEIHFSFFFFFCLCDQITKLNACIFCSQTNCLPLEKSFFIFLYGTEENYICSDLHATMIIIFMSVFRAEGHHYCIY